MLLVHIILVRNGYSIQHMHIGIVKKLIENIQQTTFLFLFFSLFLNEYWLALTKHGTNLLFIHPWCSFQVFLEKGVWQSNQKVWLSGEKGWLVFLIRTWYCKYIITLNILPYSRADIIFSASILILLHPTQRHPRICDMLFAFSFVMVNNCHL